MINLPKDSRVELLQKWIASLPSHFNIDLNSLSVASADASFRRYFRVSTAHSDFPSLIIMDAPPSHEDCAPFVTIAKLFAGAHVDVPKILAEDLEQGFLLLNDFGSETLLTVLNQNSNDVEHAAAYYQNALDELLQLQLASQPGDLPDYTKDALRQEMMLFPQWYLGVHLNYTLSDEDTAQLQQVFDNILSNNIAQAQVWVHRDYHSRNLMVTPTGLGVLDFQDALYGPITYDAVSLLRDAYIKWDEETQIDWLIRFWEKSKAAGLNVPERFDDYYKDFEYMGLQRHLKVLGIFARLYHRDGKAGYLNDLPLVLEYTRKVAARYRDFGPLLHLLDRVAAQSNTGDTTQVGYTF